MAIAGKHEVNTDEFEVRWNALLDGLSVDRLSSLFLERVLRLEDYRDGTLPASEIRRTAAASFRTLIASLRQTSDQRELAAVRQDIALEVGVSRARAGVPVESLTSAIRLDFTVLWNELMLLADPADAELLVRRAETVWHVVDSYAVQTQATYLDERQRMAQEASSVRQGYVAALFGPASTPPELLARTALELGIAEDAVLAVAAAAADGAGQLHLAAAAASRRGAAVFTHPLPDGLAAFWVAESRAGSADRETMEQIRGIRCGLVEPVHGKQRGVWRPPAAHCQLQPGGCGRPARRLVTLQRLAVQQHRAVCR